jgi:hypothetical protein
MKEDDPQEEELCGGMSVGRTPPREQPIRT